MKRNPVGEYRELQRSRGLDFLWGDSARTQPVAEIKVRCRAKLDVSARLAYAHRKLCAICRASLI